MKRIIRVIIILILLAAAAFAVAVIVQKNKDKKNKTTDQVSVIVQDPAASQPAQHPNAVVPSAEPSTPTPAPAVVPPNEPVAGSAPVADTPPTVMPAPKPASSGHILYKSANGIRVTIPASWHPQEEMRDSKTYTVFYNIQNEVVASIESYVDFGNTLELIEQQLRSSPVVYNIQRIYISSFSALQYETPQGRMVALVHNNTTYYISGQLAQDPAKVSF